jgi:hypothetical protein
MSSSSEHAYEAQFDRLVHDQICLHCQEIPADEPYDRESDTGGVCFGCLYLEHVMSKDN